jgi:hypothetical protein
LTDEAIVFGLIGGGLAMIGVAQALRLLLVIVKNTNLVLAARSPASIVGSSATGGC